MKIYDISQEVFSSKAYPGDPTPKSNKLSSLELGDLYNLSEFSMCAHSGTHIDAPLHFIKDGKSVDRLELKHLVGEAYVVSCTGYIGKNEAISILKSASEYSVETAKRILIKGDATITDESAEIFAQAGIYLIGVEGQSVGPEDSPLSVHTILLGNNVILLEGVRLSHVRDGSYLLSCAPLNLSGFEGSPCRAVLIKL